MLLRVAVHCWVPTRMTYARESELAMRPRLSVSLFFKRSYRVKYRCFLSCREASSGELAVIGLGSHWHSAAQVQNPHDNLIRNY